MELSLWCIPKSGEPRLAPDQRTVRLNWTKEEKTCVSLGDMQGWQVACSSTAWQAGQPTRWRYVASTKARLTAIHSAAVPNRANEKWLIWSICYRRSNVC